MRPWLLKKRDTPSPSSARRAMSSAETGAAFLRLFFVEILLGFGRFPERDEVVVFAFIVFTYFKNQ